MSLITSLLDGLAMLTEPFWLTLHALGVVIGEAGAGTALFSGFLLLLSLDFLRSSKGLFVPVSRVVAVGATAFFLAAFVYGDFLAAPAKAVYSALVARAEPIAPDVVVLTTLGAAGASAYLMTSRRQALRVVSAPAQPRRSSAAALRLAAGDEFGGPLALDAAGRLQLRQMRHNPKKRVSVIRAAPRALARPVGLTRSGRRVARLDSI
jgi:hypothetical protein